MEKSRHRSFQDLPMCLCSWSNIVSLDTSIDGYNRQAMVVKCIQKELSKILFVIKLEECLEKMILDYEGSRQIYVKSFRSINICCTTTENPPEKDKIKQIILTSEHFVATNLKLKSQMMIANEDLPPYWNKLACGSQIIALLIHHSSEILHHVEFIVHMGWEYEPKRFEKEIEKFFFTKLPVGNIITQGNVWKRYANTTAVSINTTTDYLSLRKLVLSTLDAQVSLCDRSLDHWLSVLESVMPQDIFMKSTSANYIKLMDIPSVMPYCHGVVADKCMPLFLPVLARINLYLIEKLNSNYINDTTDTSDLNTRMIANTHSRRELSAQKASIKQVHLACACMTFKEKVNSINLLKYHNCSLEQLNIREFCTVLNELASEPQIIIIRQGKTDSTGRTKLVYYLLNNEKVFKFAAIIYIQLGYRCSFGMRTQVDLSQALECDESHLNDIHGAGAHTIFIGEFDNLDEHENYQLEESNSISMKILEREISSVVVMSKSSGLMHMGCNIKTDEVEINCWEKIIIFKQLSRQICMNAGEIVFSSTMLNDIPVTKSSILNHIEELCLTEERICPMLLMYTGQNVRLESLSTVGKLFNKMQQLIFANKCTTDGKCMNQHVPLPLLSLTYAHPPMNNTMMDETVDIFQHSMKGVGENQQTCHNSTSQQLIEILTNYEATTEVKQVIFTYPLDITFKKNIDPLKFCEYGSTESLNGEEISTIINKLASTPHIILVEGRTGVGKSTLLQYLTSNEKLVEFSVIVYVQLGYRCSHGMRTQKDLSQALQCDESQFNDIHDAGSHALFIFDDFDNLNEHKNSIFIDILHRRIFPKSSIVILTRPSGLVYRGCSINIDHHFQIKGLNLRDPGVILLNPLIRFREDYWITTLCEQHPAILDMCETPLLAELTCRFFEQRHSNATLTDLLIYAIEKIIIREAKRKDDNIIVGDLQLFNLPNEYCDSFESICKLAFEAKLKMGILKTADDIKRFLSAFMLNNMFNLNDDESLSLVEGTVDNIHDSEISKIEFIHPLIQDFLAAFHLSMQPPMDQLVLLHQYVSLILKHCTSNTNSYMLPFFFGIVWRKKAELDLNPTKLMFSTLIEFLVSSLEVEMAKKSTHDLTLALCIAETRDNELWKKFVSKLGADLCLTLSSDDIQKYKWTIANMVSFSEVREWNIHASNFDICSELEVYIGARLNKVEISSMESTVINLSPKLSIEAASKRQRDSTKFAESPDQMHALMNHFESQAIREILQKALTMFAENVRLRGDSSNPAYVSFLSCKCFKQNLEGSIKFDPYIPFHFLEVSSNKTLKKIEEHGAHLTAAHDGKAMELVILLKPYLRRVILNYKSNEHCIVLMSEELSQKSIEKGTVACVMENTVMVTNENLMTGCNSIMEETTSSVMSEMVRPCLPLPSRSEQSFRSTVVLSQVTMAGMGHIPTAPPTCIMHSESGGDNVHHKAQKVPRNHNNIMSTSQQKQQTCTMTPAQQTHHSRSSIKAGAILFTSIPKQIPADLIYPLPDESHLIRRGGNGQIIKATVGGMEVVYKKTNYRSKEFAIITRLKHKNIVPLLAFMYGEENSAHKRRHFCYHIMPRLTGDCARMLTDKKELTIRDLHKKHGNNIRKIGTIRGNLKYLLREILHGINYLHLLHIVHRDIKGSNILLKFFCSCTNPLECGCSIKYQVKICDFDAGIELDENERLPPTQITSHPPHSQYVSFPVGTNGFRSPECSMLTISNSPDAFSPRITTRCDIWSLGMLTIRMLIGKVGPSSQREMALLLLYYHQQRYMHEGLHRPGYLEVDRLVIDRLLNVQQMVCEVGWLKGAVRFVECCIAVDSLTRYSAEGLLQHDFLY